MVFIIKNTLLNYKEIEVIGKRTEESWPFDKLDTFKLLIILNCLCLIS